MKTPTSQETLDDALTGLFKEFSPMLTLLCRKVLLNEADAEDLVHDVFLLKVPSKLMLGDLPTRRDWAHWLIAVCKNACLDKLRSRSRDARLLTSAAHEMSAFRTPLADQEEMNLLEREQKLQELLAALEPRYRQVLQLKYLLQNTWDEVASVLGLSTQGARKRAQLAMKQIKDRELEQCRDEKKKKRKGEDGKGGDRYDSK